MGEESEIDTVFCCGDIQIRTYKSAIFLKGVVYLVSVPDGLGMYLHIV